MRIPRIFTGQDITAGVTVQLEAGASQHLSRALRLNVGDSLCLFNGSGREWPCQITSIDKKHVSVMPAEPLVRDLESPLTIHLGIAISRGDRMDMVIQKSTELGVTAITPILTERTEVKLKGEREQKKLQHWRQITISACEQSGRNTLPELHSPRPVEPVAGTQRWRAAVCSASSWRRGSEHSSCAGLRRSSYRAGGWPYARRNRRRRRPRVPVPDPGAQGAENRDGAAGGDRHTAGPLG